VKDDRVGQLISLAQWSDRSTRLAFVMAAWMSAVEDEATVAPSRPLLTRTDVRRCSISGNQTDAMPSLRTSPVRLTVSQRGERLHHLGQGTCGHLTLRAINVGYLGGPRRRRSTELLRPMRCAHTGGAATASTRGGSGVGEVSLQIPGASPTRSHKAAGLVGWAARFERGLAGRLMLMESVRTAVRPE
jgi:hypothetical protein